MLADAFGDRQALVDFRHRDRDRDVVEALRRDKQRGQAGAPIAGAVLGRALYAGTIKPAEALAAA